MSTKERMHRYYIRQLNLRQARKALYLLAEGRTLASALDAVCS